MNVVHENVLVEISEKDKVSNGVLLPESHIVAEREGTVIRFGDAVPAELQKRLIQKPTVLYKEYYDGEEITVAGKKYIVMNFKDIMLIK